MNRSKFSKKIIDFVIVLTIILNICGAPLAKRFDIPTFIFTAIPLFFLFIINLRLNKFDFTINKHTRMLICVSILIFALHTFKSLFYSGIGFGDDEVKYLLYLITFLVSISVLQIENWNAVEFSLTVVSLFLSFDALQYLPLMLSTGTRIYNVTNYTFLDKPVYTLTITLSVICLLINILGTDNKRIAKYLMILLTIFLGGINLILIQSKLFILVLAGFFLILCLFSNRISIKNVLIFLFLVFLGLFIYFLFFPQYVPDYIYIFLNRYLGVFDNIISDIQAYDRYTATYYYRGTIYNYAFELFIKNFFIGVGFGNYKKYAAMNSSLLNGVTQTESAYVNLLVEGGIIYFISHMIFLCFLFKNLWKIQSHDRKNTHILKMLLLLISYFILNAGNDFYSAQYWLILAFIYKSAAIKELNI